MCVAVLREAVCIFVPMHVFVGLFSSWTFELLVPDESLE